MIQPSEVKALRTAAGLSQRELATLIGWQKQNVSAVENGRQTISDAMAERIAAACGYELVISYRFEKK